MDYQFVFLLIGEEMDFCFIAHPIFFVSYEGVSNVPGSEEMHKNDNLEKGVFL